MSPRRELVTGDLISAVFARGQDCPLPPYEQRAWKKKQDLFHSDRHVE